MSEIKFEVGKFYRTRDNRKLKFIGDSRDAEYCTHNSPLVFIDMKNGCRIFLNENGRVRDASDNELDIVGEWKEPVTRTARFSFYLVRSSDGEFHVTDVMPPWMLPVIGHKSVEVTITEGDGING